MSKATEGERPFHTCKINIKNKVNININGSGRGAPALQTKNRMIGRAVR
jgi:hypothetical protein